MSQNKPNIEQTQKLEQAKKIAAKKPKVKKEIFTGESKILQLMHLLSNAINKILMSNVFSTIFALVLAVILYVAVTASSSTIDVYQSATLTGIPVKTVYNTEIYEVTGIPETVDVIVQGDMSDITLQRSQISSNVVCDLSGLIEGTYSVKLVPTNFSSQLTVNVLNTPMVNVTIKKKVTSKFTISYEFINKNAMDKTYTLKEPVFDSTEVLIRASQDTIDSIAFVKALIDVTGVSGTCSKNATIMAYDNNGNIVNCDIIPETVTATVSVDTKSKTVPIVVRPTGELVEGMSIDSITLDYQTITIYAPSEILNSLDAIYIDVDVSSITKNTALFTTLEKPAGVTSMSITKVNMDITLGATVSKVIENVKVSWINYNSEYKFKLVNSEDAVMNVTVSGTANNIEKILSSEISVYIDLSNASVGLQQVPLLVSGTNKYVDYSITSGKSYVEIELTK